MIAAAKPGLPINELYHTAYDYVKEMDSIDKKMKIKLTKEISLLQEYGNMVREPYSKHLQDGIYELRAQQGNDISRVLYFFYVGRKIILTHGFIKKTQKTPLREIELAKIYREIYFSDMEVEQ